MKKDRSNQKFSGQINDLENVFYKRLIRAQYEIMLSLCI